MLVLRKELKLGVGIGATVLGIAGVYGLMAMLSSGNADHGTQQTAINSTEGKSGDTPAAPHGLDTAISGLPPKIDAKLPDPAKPSPSADPFAESNRTDGNVKNSPWTTDAFTTGRVGADVKNPPAIVKLDGGKPDAPEITHSPTPAGTHTLSLPEPKVATVASSAGLSSSLPATPTSAKPVAGGKYVIQSGDTFSTIAAKVYGSKKFSAALVKANPEVNPSRLRIGHEINLPAKEAVGGGTARGSIETDRPLMTTPIDASRQYRVATGDTLSGISTKLYGKPNMWQAIYEANKSAIGADAGRLKLGTVLELPQRPDAAIAR